MIGLSPTARQALLDGVAVARAYVDVYSGDAWLRDVPLDEAGPGSITVDATAANLRTGTLNFAPDVAGEVLPLIPLTAGPLSPVGNEARVRVELTIPGAAVEVIPVGVLGLRRPEADDYGPQVVSVAGKDRSQRVIDASLTVPVDVPDGKNIATAIHDLVDDGVPGLTYVGFDEADTPHTTVGLHFAVGDDRWRRGTEMADSVGKRLVFDAVGELVLSPVPDPATTDPVWTYAEGADQLATRIRQAVDADQTYSHAIAIGTPADPHTAPVRSDAYDDDPASPTYYLGPFGDRPVRMESAYISTQPQADDASAGLLRRKSGLIEELTVTAMSIYAHEDWDVVLVRRAALGIDAHYVLDRFPVPLGPATADYTMRSRRVS